GLDRTTQLRGFAVPGLSEHATFPSGFRLPVGSVTQRSHTPPLPLLRGSTTPLRGAPTKLTCRRDARGGLALEDKRRAAQNVAGQVQRLVRLVTSSAVSTASVSSTGTSLSWCSHQIIARRSPRRQ